MLTATAPQLLHVFAEVRIVYANLMYESQLLLQLPQTSKDNLGNPIEQY